MTRHPWCDSANAPGGRDACLKERKYQLTWQRPEDTANLKGYRIYLDTNQENDTKSWDAVSSRPELASIIVNRIPPRDTVVFTLSDTPRGSPDTLGPGEKRILTLDSTGRSDLVTGQLMFALVPVYSGGVTPGKPQFGFFVTTDKQAPDVFHPKYQPQPHGVSIAWQRPTDRVSFFNPAMDTGLIAGYGIEIRLGGAILLERKKAFLPELKTYLRGGEDSLASVKDSVVLTKDGFKERVFFFLPDGARSAKRTRTEIADTLKVEIGGLMPREFLKLMVWAIDSAGNSNRVAMEEVSLWTTDTTQPSKPELSVDSLGRNSFIIVWKASTDSVAGPDGSLIEAKAPNVNIKNYRITRIHVRPNDGFDAGQDRIDTVLQMDTVLAKRKEFRIPVDFLPPGATYKISIQAEDSSGYLSREDTTRVTTLPVEFAAADSALTCPPGFVPIPRGSFRLGDPNGDSKGDEAPPRELAMAPYCIEPYEHLDSTGKRFVSNVTWEQAESICRSLDPYYDTRLCTEAEWERACEGALENGPAHPHGIQSEGSDPSALLTRCNHATNDSAMAMSYELRNPVCLTAEGVYDMSGNLSEWVRDTYSPRAYESFQGKPPFAWDHDSVLADSGLAAPRSIRGGNYLKPNLGQQSQVQSLARCSNRDYPAQVRPLFRDSCKSESGPKLAVIYGPGLEGHRCIDLDEKFRGPDVTGLQPAPVDTFKILVFRSGKPVPDTIYLDTSGVFATFKGRKPIAAKITQRVLAEVTFEKISDPGTRYTDILDASEFRDTTQAGLAKIFAREAGNDDWTVHKENGAFAVKYYYGYAIIGSKPALPFYSSRAIGFRCCSRALPARED